jgi:hypothetical protein
MCDTKATFLLAQHKRSSLNGGNYSPPFWEILLDTVTAESRTGEG